jgi:periplasmic protein TonB
MQTTDYAVATMDEIVFAGRNQAYGAFVLRQQYRHNLFKGWLTGLGLAVLFILSHQIYSRFHVAEEKYIWRKETILSPPPDLTQNEEPLPQVEIPKPLPRQNLTRFLPPVILPNEKAHEELPPPQNELRNSNPASVNQIGDDSTNIDILPEENTGKSIVGEKEEDDKPVLFVQNMPTFEGGNAALMKFLQRHLKYPRAAQNAGIQGRVFVSFVVGKNGEITDVEVLKGIGFGCDEEAERVIKLMPNWNPGRQGSKTVRVRYTMPVVFKMGE